MSEAPRLYQLQVIDLDLDEKRRQLQQAEEKLGETSALQAAREKRAAADSQLKEVEQRIRGLEQDLEGRSAKIAELQKRLFGGAVGKQKEASALEKELQGLKQARGRIEDELLDAMAEVEELPKRLADVQAELERAEAAWAEAQAVLRGEIESLRAEVDAAEITRRRVAAELPSSVLEIYEDLRRRHRGRAVARVERNTCQGCRVALPMREVQRARTNPELSFCSFCGRILHVER